MEAFRKMRRFRQALSEEDCVAVLQSAPRGIMAFHGENGYPYAIPLNQYYDPEDGKLYFHGAKQGLKLDLLEKENKVCFTVMDEGFVKEGEWALNIRSVVCLGQVEALTDHEKVLEQCRKLARKFYPTEKDVEDEVEKAGSRVHMLVMTIDRMTGKLVNES
ncbi:pyridoxamine 5'-phosphate oxidase family protein [Oribacterium sp. oral taxon 102]|nr:pyridoxamine 5'-phosphate oxidase family protein [Oribacterium sp. oral taxon 102]NWO20477.1 pyridoxamine 5'-phosphate oxidase family protein [Oribacterium sp. oral taxon 102]